MKTRQDRERELQQMPKATLLVLYREVCGLPPGTVPDAGTPLVSEILKKEYPGSGNEEPTSP